MHKEVLTKAQHSLLPLVKLFASDFVLVGGTAIALQIGHRQSIDFYFCQYDTLANFKIRKNCAAQQNQSSNTRRKRRIHGDRE